MRKINKIKTLTLLLEAEKQYWKSWDKLIDAEIFGENVELILGFDFTNIIFEILDYEEEAYDFVSNCVFDYVQNKCTLEETITMLLNN